VDKDTTIWFTLKQYKSYYSKTVEEMTDILTEAGIDPQKYQVEKTDTHFVISNWE
jgi:hypothetical protein